MKDRAPTLLRTGKFSVFNAVPEARVKLPPIEVRVEAEIDVTPVMLGPRSDPVSFCIPSKEISPAMAVARAIDPLNVAQPATAVASVMAESVVVAETEHWARREESVSFDSQTERCTRKAAKVEEFGNTLVERRPVVGNRNVGCERVVRHTVRAAGRRDGRKDVS